MWMTETIDGLGVSLSIPEVLLVDLVVHVGVPVGSERSSSSVRRFVVANARVRP